MKESIVARSPTIQWSMKRWRRDINKGRKNPGSVKKQSRQVYELKREAEAGEVECARMKGNSHIW